MIKRILLTAFFCVLAWVGIHAQVSVVLQYDTCFKNEAIVKKMEANLSKVLTEINSAYEAKREIKVVGLPMDKFAQESLSSLWANAQFHVDDDYPVLRLWNFSNGYMVRQIPLRLFPRDKSADKDIYQEAAVYFDTDGNISDFTFVSLKQLRESLEKGGDPVDKERKAIILKYCDRFCTAYNTKDMEFMRQVFGGDGLIITNSVVRTKATDGNIPRKYNQDKEHYLASLQNVFSKNEWIKVTFYEIGYKGEGGGSAITRSCENPNFYGVRLRLLWESSSYREEGYIFWLWDFTNEDKPVIHVRTWQPEYIEKDKKLSEKDLFTLEDFGL